MSRIIEILRRGLVCGLRKKLSNHTLAKHANISSIAVSAAVTDLAALCNATFRVLHLHTVHHLSCLGVCLHVPLAGDGQHLGLTTCGGSEGSVLSWVVRVVLM